MTRIVAGENAAELTKDSVKGCVLVDLDFSSGHLYLNDGFHDCVYNGNTYLPLGQFAGIESVNETVDEIARPVTLTLSGVDPTLVGTAETEIYQNRKVIVYVALIDQSTGAFVAPPEIAWEGRMDYMEIALDKNVGKITLNCEHRLRREPRIARYTDADQQTAHTGDSFFGFTSQIVGFKAVWGNQQVDYGGPTGGGPVSGGGGQRYTGPYSGGGGRR